MKLTKNPPLPQEIVVRWAGDGGEDPFLVAETTNEGAEDGEVVAIYELRETRIKRVTHTLE
jgi:hypothetical protein